MDPLQRGLCGILLVVEAGDEGSNGLGYLPDLLAGELGQGVLKRLDEGGGLGRRMGSREQHQQHTK